MTNDNAQGIKKDEDAYLLEKLNGFIVKKNTMRLSEYKKYAPLFKTEGLSIPTEDTPKKEVWAYNDKVEHLQKLGMEWGFRVSLNHPVNIVSDSDETKILFTLPAVFSTVPPVNVNDATGERTDKVDALMNMIKTDDGFRDRVTPAAKKVEALLKTSRTDEERVDIKNEFIKHASVIETVHPKEEETDQEINPKDALDGAVWE